MKLRVVRVEKVQGQESVITLVWEGEHPTAYGESIGRYDDGKCQINRYFEVELSTYWQPLTYDPRDRAFRNSWDALKSYVEVERGYMTLSCTCVTYADNLKSFLERLALYPC